MSDTLTREEIIQWVRACGAESGHFTSNEACQDFANQLQERLIPSPKIAAWCAHCKQPIYEKQMMWFGGKQYPNVYHDGCQDKG